MSSLRLAHTSRDRSSSSSVVAASGGNSSSGGITNEAFAQSSVSLYKRISSTENLANTTSSHLESQQQPNTRLLSTSVISLAAVTSSTTPGTDSSSPKGGSRNEATSGPNSGSSPGSSNSSTTVYYQHSVHNHHQQATSNELIAIKSKFEAEFRRFSLQRSDITNLDDFMKTIEHFHKLFSIPFNLFYADPVHGDLLPINNDVNFGLAISSAKPLLRLFVQRKDGTFGYFPMGSSASNNKTKNFLGTLLPSSSSSSHTKPRLAISAPEDFRQVSSIIDVDIVPDTCRRVRLVKHGSDKPLGFYIRDGTSVRVTAHGVEKVPGIFISRLIPGGLAESTGLLAVNDEVLEVNGIEVNGKSLDQVTDMMVANSSNLIITIRPANQRGHSTLSGSFSSNTISGAGGTREHVHHAHSQQQQTNSLERGAGRVKKMQAPQPPGGGGPGALDFHNPHHTVHSFASGQASAGPGSTSTNTSAFESLQRTAAHRHSASMIHGHGGGHQGGHSHSFHHDPVQLGFHHHSHLASHPHHHQFTGSNRHSVIGGPGMSEGVSMVTGGSLGGALQGPSVLHHDEDTSEDEEDEVRDHFTTSLVINSGDSTTGPGGSHSQMTSKSNGSLNTTTVIVNSNPSGPSNYQQQHFQNQPRTISTTTVPIGRNSNSNNSSNSQGAAAASAAAFIRNSLRGKGSSSGSSGPGKSYSGTAQQQPSDRALYAHLYHPEQTRSTSNNHRSPSGSPTAGNSRKGGNSTQADDIVTL